MHIRTYFFMAIIGTVCVLVAAVREIALPWSSTALPEKFTSRGTTVDDATDGVASWAVKKKQRAGIVSNTKSEYLVDRMARTSLLSFSAAENECWKNSVLTNLGRWWTRIELARPVV
jgi:hypothetical protein